MSFPKALSSWIPERFDDDAKPLYGQAATSGKDGAPKVRTVHFRWIRTLERLGFACHRHSPKWRELTENPRAACCYFHPKLGVQLRWEARADLIADGASPAARELWERSEDWLKREYGGETQAPPSVFGVVVLEIERWDCYTVDAQNPAKNERFVYALKDGVWREEKRGALL